MYEVSKMNKQIKEMVKEYEQFLENAPPIIVTYEHWLVMTLATTRIHLDEIKDRVQDVKQAMKGEK